MRGKVGRAEEIKGHKAGMNAEKKVTLEAHLQHQISSGGGQEDSVAPGGASGVHVLLPLTAVLTVRIAGGGRKKENKHRIQ